jgi:hypothetical protein
MQAKHTQAQKVFGTFIHRIVRPKVAELPLLRFVINGIHETLIQLLHLRNFFGAGT